MWRWCVRVQRETEKRISQLSVRWNPFKKKILQIDLFQNIIILSGLFFIVVQFVVKLTYFSESQGVWSHYEPDGIATVQYINILQKHTTTNHV